MESDIEIRERPQRLVGEIFQARRLDKRQKEVVHFAKEGLGIAIELPVKQSELIGEYLTKEPPERWYFWVYPEETDQGWRGVVIAGPLNEGINKSADLLSDVQMARWFNQLLSPLGEISRVEEIDPTGKISFKVKEDKKVSFKKIWDAFEKEEEKEREGERRERGYKRAIRRFLPMKGIRGEAARRHVEIGKD